VVWGGALMDLAMLLDRLLELWNGGANVVVTLAGFGIMACRLWWVDRCRAQAEAEKLRAEARTVSESVYGDLVSHLEKRIDDLQAEIRELREERDRSQAERNQELSELKREIAELKVENAQLRRDREELLTENRRLKLRIDALAKELEDLRAMLPKHCDDGEGGLHE